MLTKNGSQMLQAFTAENFQEQFVQVTTGLWHATGLGHSNAVVVEGKTSVLLIDTLDTYERGCRLLAQIEQATHKPVKTIVYTHGHPDHRGGAGAFAATEPEIIAFAPKTPPLEHTAQLEQIQNLRGSRQFGYDLTDEEAISQGIGLREGITQGERRAFVAPTTVYGEDTVTREIDGLQVVLTRLPGEAEDQVMVWLPQKKVLCCGDNYYGCFPNLYAIRGGQYRDLAVWVKSLDALTAFPAEYLLPGHTRAICGNGAIRQVLGHFKSAIEYLLTKTLDGMNEGKSADQLAAEIRLPPEYASLPYLGEFYGCAEWTVRAIYAAYLGWFDGNPTQLHPLSPQSRSQKTLALLGGCPKALQAAQDALAAQDWQWCLELCDLLLAHDPQERTPALLKADALEQLAARETSANGRHYYLACAKELRAGGQ